MHVINIATNLLLYHVTFMSTYMMILNHEPIVPILSRCYGCLYVDIILDLKVPGPVVFILLLHLLDSQT